MTAFLALIRREYIEHKGPFLLAPAVLVALLAGCVVLMAVSGQTSFVFDMAFSQVIKIFEFGYIGFAYAWWIYLLVALFFYFADVFSADKRNNALLFWKSMPQSDLKILVSKFAAGLTLFPTLIFLALLATGLLVYIAIIAALSAVTTLAVPGFFELLGSFVAVTLAALGFIVLGLLWYAPFFAWLGALSTLVGRWSMPLAFLIPGMLVVFENLLTQGGDLHGGHLWAFFNARMHYGPDQSSVIGALLANAPFSATAFITDLLSHIDWPMMVGGWAFALAALYVASEFRRRSNAG